MRTTIHGQRDRRRSFEEVVGGVVGVGPLDGVISWLGPEPIRGKTPPPSRPLGTSRGPQHPPRCDMSNSPTRIRPADLCTLHSPAASHCSALCGAILDSCCHLKQMPPLRRIASSTYTGYAAARRHACWFVCCSFRAIGPFHTRRHERNTTSPLRWVALLT
jgi:hypothetical protein